MLRRFPEKKLPDHKVGWALPTNYNVYLTDVAGNARPT